MTAAVVETPVATGAPTTTSWSVWGMDARLAVTDPAALPAARAAVDAVTDAVGAVASRFRDDAEIVRLPDDGRPHAVSPLLGELVTTALTAARRTDGDVDPTLGVELAALGYDRDLALLVRAAVDAPVDVPVVLRPRTRRAWRAVTVEHDDAEADGPVLTVPTGVRLDLGATAKAWAVDRAAARAAERTGCGVLVALGGDLATAGPGPADGWVVEVGETAGPCCLLALGPGGALATSGTTRRRWRHVGATVHHLLDPRTARPAREDWVSVSVAAGSCVEANTVSTAAVVRGHVATAWLRELEVDARLVTAAGEVVTVGRWPAESGEMS